MTLRRRTLRGRLALWITLSTALSLFIFALVSYMVVMHEEKADVASGAPEDMAADVRREVLVAMAFAAPVGLLLSFGLVLLVTRRALAPVDRVIRAAAEISTEKLDRRIEAPARDDELRALVLALNGLLERLEAGHQALALFAADVSHELRTPLTVIGSELEVALRRSRSIAEWEGSARTSLEEVRRLGRLIDALLRLARSDAARQGPTERVDFVSLVEQARASAAALAGKSGVTLGPVEGGANDMTEAMVDALPDALASAVSNVIANAVRYTPSGGTVSLSVERLGPRIALKVDDTGPGLDPGELETVFTPFVRGAQGRARDATDPGLGLGLAIARRVVERHGGSVRAENRAEGGARFTIELPLAPS